MFSCLVDSTTQSTSLDSRNLRELIDEYDTACAACVVRFGGYVANRMGEGVLAYFGYPQEYEDDAIRAIHAGLEILGEMVLIEKAGFTPKVRIGVATGLDAIGDLVGEAAHLQRLAHPGTLVITPETRRLAGAVFEYQDLGETRLRGFAEPIRAWQVVDRRGIRTELSSG
jgi:class 3 adenylate cyclase